MLECEQLFHTNAMTDDSFPRKVKSKRFLFNKFKLAFQWLDTVGHGEINAIYAYSVFITKLEEQDVSKRKLKATKRNAKKTLINTINI